MIDAQPQHPPAPRFRESVRRPDPLSCNDVVPTLALSRRVLPNPLTPLRAAIRHWVLSAFPRDPVDPVDYDHPSGDPGLFGPDSATWRIHADFPGMLAGGLSALMLQCLHPLALAGVWDHSNFRHDLIGRLRRTTRFVAATTYAGTDEARRWIERVRGIHARVRGTAPDGRAYSADDPALLTWVHVTEAWGFLAGFRRYRATLPDGAADRYFDETRRVAEALGARDVPRSEAEVLAYFRAVQPNLICDQRSREVLTVLESIALPVPAAGLSRRLFLGAAIAVLPGWAVRMLGYDRGSQPLRTAIAARTLATLAPLVRGSLSDGIASRACRRVGADPAILEHWTS